MARRGGRIQVDLLVVSVAADGSTGASDSYGGAGSTWTVIGLAVGGPGIGQPGASGAVFLGWRMFFAGAAGDCLPARHRAWDSGCVAGTTRGGHLSRPRRPSTTSYAATTRTCSPSSVSSEPPSLPCHALPIVGAVRGVLDDSQLNLQSLLHATHRGGDQCHSGVVSLRSERV